VAWVESNQEVGRHPKTKKLARLLDISRRKAGVFLPYCSPLCVISTMADGHTPGHRTDHIARTGKCGMRPPVVPAIACLQKSFITIYIL